tara:strand:- start:50 stop:826 length:777 start_codon:yes stop_codon:yes gene_type:complete
MSALALLGALFACVFVGLASALMGLGGGMFMVPLLDLIPGVSWQEAAATSLTCALATSAAGSVAFDKGKLADLELVVLLELSGTVGALVGAAVLATIVPERVSAGVFSALVAYAAWKMVRRRQDAKEEPQPEGPVEHLGLGIAGAGVAGILSGLLGIGGGPVKVPLQTELCRIPLKVALANSNLMVGITAGVGAAVYFAKGVVLAHLIAPCAIGIALGAYLGGLLMPKLPVARLRAGFVVVLLVLLGRMLWKTLGLGS